MHLRSEMMMAYKLHAAVEGTRNKVYLPTNASQKSRSGFPGLASTSLETYVIFGSSGTFSGKKSRYLVVGCVMEIRIFIIKTSPRRESSRDVTVFLMLGSHVKPVCSNC